MGLGKKGERASGSWDFGFKVFGVRALQIESKVW